MCLKIHQNIDCVQPSGLVKVNYQIAEIVQCMDRLTLKGSEGATTVTRIVIYKNPGVLHSAKNLPRKVSFLEKFFREIKCTHENSFGRGMDTRLGSVLCDRQQKHAHQGVQADEFGGCTLAMKNILLSLAGDVILFPPSSKCPVELIYV
jgi:hypothetical protein